MVKVLSLQENKMMALLVADLQTLIPQQLTIEKTMLNQWGETKG
jgi:hypothetical protein